MAVASYPVGDALAAKLWSKALAVEMLKAIDVAPLIGDDANAAIQMKTELSKQPGDQVTFGLRTQLQGDGVSEGETLEGNEEALSTWSDKLTINELAHAVRVKGDTRIDAKRIPFNAQKEAKDGLRDWYKKRMNVSIFNQLGGNTAELRAKYSGFNTITAPSSTRRIACNATTTTADASLSSSDKFQLKYIDIAVERAKFNTDTPGPIRPLMVDGAEKYVIYLHPYQVTDLRQDATTAGNWFDITKAAMQGGQISKNPIYTGALGEYNGVIIRQAPDVPTGVNAGTGAAITTVRRAIFMGAQAGVIGFANGYNSTTFDWQEESFDYAREYGISAQTIFGVKKTVFNSVDFGVITIHSYAAAH